MDRIDDGNFLKAHKFTAEWEGGISDHPADAGGYTRYGVSQEYMKDLRRRKTGLLARLGLYPGDIRVCMDRVGPDEAAAIFHDDFWLPNACGLLWPGFGLLVYDAAVNHGSRQGVKFCQRAWNGHAEGQKLAVDGMIGPKTIQALRYRHDRVAQTAIDQRELFYKDLAARKPSQKAFLKGWLNRAQSLRQFLKNNY